MALAVVTLAVVLLAIDGTVLALAVPSLTESLAPTATQILWIGDIYSLALAGLLITMGNVADRIGRKRLLLIGAVGFGLASAIAAFAPTPELLIAARALLGISGATIMPSTLSIVRNLFPDARQRTRAIAIWSAGATGGAAVGPLVGGVLLENFWWGSVFLINVPVVLILVPAGIFLLPESRNVRAGRIDVVSAILSLCAIVPIVYSAKTFATAGVSAEGVGAAVLGAFCGAIFVLRQRRLAHPMIDIALFKKPAFSGAVISNTMAIFAFVGVLFFFSQYLQLVRGFGPLQAGLLELPATIASLLVVIVIGTMVSKWGRGPVIGAGLGTAAVGMVILAGGEPLEGIGILVLALTVIGVGAGVAMTVSVDAVMTAVPRERAGAASAVSETAYELGIALGIAILGSILTSNYRSGLSLPDGLDSKTETTIRDSLASASHAPEHLYLMAQESFVSAMQNTSLIAAALTAIAAVIAWRLIPATRHSSDGH
ncbi:MFS transporter, DHA2 family, multidrug resistance protein [Agreia sp. VKM Ac-1783]|nr:MFS transporter, DHA2 family, multidrug resistance protein [Agreia sp. VKM Ac-1783]